MTEEQIVEIVNRYLEAHQYEDVKIMALGHGVRSDGDWWYVPVRSETPMRTYRFYDELTEVEMELKDKEKLDVLLVPAA